jgi:hypothetical protein
MRRICTKLVLALVVVDGQLRCQMLLQQLLQVVPAG